MPKCEVRRENCTGQAVYEAWFRNKTIFGNPGGINQRLLCCEPCSKYSIGYENGNTPKIDGEVNVPEAEELLLQRITERLRQYRQHTDNFVDRLRMERNMGHYTNPERHVLDDVLRWWLDEMAPMALEDKTGPVETE